jgi:hypothetical protein
MFVAILFVNIGGYYISGYWWILVVINVIMLVVISGYSILSH